MSYRVTAYLQAGITYSFSARCKLHGREIANRIIREGLWVDSPDGEDHGVELFFPTHLIEKVKLVVEDVA